LVIVNILALLIKYTFYIFAEKNYEMS